MLVSRESILPIALLTLVALSFLSLDNQEKTGGGPQPFEAKCEDESRVNRTNLSEAPALVKGSRGLPSAGGGSKAERAPLPSSSGQKRAAEVASSGWIGDVYLRLSGNESFPDHQILNTLDLPRGQEPRALTRTIRGQIRTFYRSYGFAEARVKAAVAESDPIIVDVQVYEGRVLSYAGIEVAGASVLSSQEVTALFPEPGGFVDWVRMREASLSLRQKYHEMGFAGVIISDKVSVDRSSGLLRYRIRIVEGAEYRVGRVSLPSELESHFPLSSGELFRPSLLDEFLRENGLSEAQLQLEHNPGDGLVEITLVEAGGA